MVALPSGTVTFLFTDIEGSSRMWERKPQAMAGALARHDEILQSTIEDHGGYVFKTVGDAFCAVFSTAPEALQAALSAQRALLVNEDLGEAGPLLVRMALHTGSAEERDGDYFGPLLNRVARLLSTGCGGQTLLSLPTQELVRDQLPLGAELRDLGEHRLKDLARPEHIFELLAPDLPADFPPLRTLASRPNNLPMQPTPLVGREKEVEDVRVRLLAPEVRLLTLTGPGGTGKTRLALQAAADLLEEFEDGVFFVSLAALTDPTLVVSTVAKALGVRESVNQPLIEGMKVFLEDLSQYEVVRLFIERAKAAKADFEITNENAPAVAEICVRLDGLPLAIELAAARVKLLPPKAMLGRLGRRLKLLTGGARNLPERYRTLRGAIEWSHTLLDEGEKTLFARMAVFSGGCTLEAVEAVCDAHGDLPVGSFEGVSSLLGKSLVRQEEGPEGEPRVVMLETIHEYARERLEESGAVEEIWRAHAEYFLALAEEAEPEIEGPNQVSWMDRLEAEHDNLRAALSWSLERGDAESVLRIGGALWLFWIVRGHFSEGRRWLTAGLSGEETAPTGIKARALLALGDLTLEQGDYTLAVEDLEASLALYREAGDQSGEAYSLCFLGWIAMDRSDLEQAERLLEESLALSRTAGTARAISLALNALSGLADARGDSGRRSA